MSNSEFSIREVTKGALSQARSKLKPYAFIRLNEVAVDPSIKSLNLIFGKVIVFWP